MYFSRIGCQIISWNTSDTVATSGQYTLTLPDVNQNTITFMAAATNGIWIGTVNTIGGQGAVYFWDGSAGNAYKYVLESTGTPAGVIKDDVLYIMDNNGRLLHFNGGTFVEDARLPLYRKKTFTNAINRNNDRWIHPNGMALIEGRINILINTLESSSDSSTEEMCPSGIWEYDADTKSLYHKYSFSYYNKAVGTVNDYGQQRMLIAGGLTYAKTTSTSSTNYGTFMAGVKMYQDATSSMFAIFYDDTGDLAIKTGYFVTVKIPSSGIVDTWQRMALKYNNLSNASNKIVVKYRLDDYDPLEATITWVTTTSFTTTADISFYAVGDEVEITQGPGGGMCSHITAISLNAGTYTVTVDEVHTGVTTETAKGRFQKWKKLGSVADTTSTFKIMQFPSSATSAFIQLKIFMLMYGADELKEVDIQNKVAQDLK